MEDPNVWVGVDWGEEECEVRFEVGEQRDGVRIRSTTDDLEAFCQRLLTLSDGVASRVCIGIERPTGKIVDHFVDAGFRVFAINPKQVDRARDVFSMSGAKDDRRDAAVILKLLRTAREAFREIADPNPAVQQIRSAERTYHDLVGERTRVKNALRARLVEYHPRLLELAEMDSGWFIPLFRACPSPLKKPKRTDLERIVKRSRLRVHTAESIAATLAQSAPARTKAAIDAAAFEAALLVDRLELIEDQISRVESRLSDLIAEYVKTLRASNGDMLTDVEIFASMPGVGPVVLATAVGEGLLGIVQQDVELARVYSGVAPVTRTTGKRQKQGQPVDMRRACNTLLRQAMHFMGQNAGNTDLRLRARYAELRARRHTHARACRQISDRQLRVLAAMLRDRTTYHLDKNERSSSSVQRGSKQDNAP